QSFSTQLCVDEKPWLGCTSIFPRVGVPCIRCNNTLGLSCAAGARAGLSQEALAAEANLHRNYVGLLERGQRMPSILVVQQLATALSTTMSELLAEVEQEQE